MPWGDYLHTGTVPLRDKRTGRERPTSVRDGDWRDTTPQNVPMPLARAGQDFVRAHVKDLVIVGARTTTPPACHVEAPSA
jgi:hypothetical protein